MSLSLLDATTWINSFDFTTRLNEISLEIPVEALDDNRFGGNDTPRVGRSRIAGLEDVTAELNGFWEAPVDEASFSGLGTADQVVTHSVDGAETSVAYLYTSRKFTYQAFGEVGSNTPFTVNLQGSRGNGSPGAVRGQVAAAKQDVSTTGQVGSIVNLGDVASGEHLYAVVHVFTIGTSIDIDIESDSDTNFGDGDETVQLSFSLTAEGATLKRTPGAITDTHFRAVVTANSGTSTIGVPIGIK